MSSLVKKWVEHLNENNMTYCEHWKFAVSHGISCILAGFYLIIHGTLPCFYRHAGSELIHQLEKDFVNHARKQGYKKTNIDINE